MKIKRLDPPRSFEVGRGEKVLINDCARINLAPNEQVTFVSDAGAEYDVARKDWGFYATPSTNSRLRKFGWRSALVRSPSGQYYVFLLESGKDAEFHRYLKLESHRVICWLDDDADLNRITDIFSSDR